jgi:hypothetical protein
VEYRQQHQDDMTGRYLKTISCVAQDSFISLDQRAVSGIDLKMSAYLYTSPSLSAAVAIGFSDYSGLFYHAATAHIPLSDTKRA